VSLLGQAVPALDDVPREYAVLVVSALVTVIGTLVGVIVILYRAIRECDATKLELAKEFADAAKDREVDAQKRDDDVIHRLDTIHEAIKGCGLR